MKASNGHRVSVHYTLRTDGRDGELVEQTAEDSPFRFTMGRGEVLEKFEAAIAGKEPGESFEIFIECEDAYGPETDEALIEFPKSTFVTGSEEDDPELEVGEVMPMMDEQGNELFGVVTQLKSDSVVLDFNHPLAGDDLFFTGTVVAVEQA